MPLFKCPNCGWVQDIKKPFVSIRLFCPSCQSIQCLNRLHIAEIFIDTKEVLLQQPYFAANHDFTEEHQILAKKMVLENI